MSFERLQIVVTIARQLFDFGEQLFVNRGLGFAAIEDGDFMAAAQRVLDLVRPGKGGASEDQDAQRLFGFPRRAATSRRPEHTESDGATGRRRHLQELSSRRRHSASPSSPVVEAVSAFSKQPPAGHRRADAPHLEQGTQTTSFAG